MLSHEVTYKIIGQDIQLLEIELAPNEAVIAEAGAMIYMEQDINFETKLGDGSGDVINTLFGVGKRMLSGDSVFLTHFTNKGREKRRVAFAATYPGAIVALNLAELGQQVICQKSAFLTAALGTKMDIAFTKRLGSGFFGGDGFILQRLRGDGLVFIHAGGTVIRKELRKETLRVEIGCLVAFSGNIDYNIARSGSLRSMLFGGEGLFLATLKGAGSVWVQSMPFSRLADSVLEHYQPVEQKQG